MGPVFDELSEEYKDKMIFGKVNVDEQPALAQAARVQAIPTLVLFHKGVVKDVFVGATSKARLRERLGELLGASGTFRDAARSAAG